MGSNLSAILQEVDAKRLDGHLDWLSAVRRDTGGPGEEKTVGYIVDTLKADGIEVRVHEFDAYLAYPRMAALETIGTESTETFKSLTHSFAVSTGPNGRVADVVYVPEDGDLRQAAGRFALLDGLASPIKILQASKARCAGVIFVNAEWYIHNMIGSTIWGGAPTPDMTDRLPIVPVVSVNNESGARIKELLAKGPLQLLMTTEVETGWFRSKLPEAIVRPDKPIDDKFVLTGGHYCSWEYGTTDNSTGVTDILELARVTHKFRNDFQRELRFAFWPGHSHGRYAGSTYYADTFFDELAKKCITYHNIDSPGVRGASTYVVRHTTADLEDVGRRIIEANTPQKNPEAHRPNRSADESFVGNGVSAISLYSFIPSDHPDRKPWTGGCAGAWWWHTEHDTRDKADTNVLVTDTRASVALLHELANSVRIPLKPSNILTDILEVLEEADARAGNELQTAEIVKLAKHTVKKTKEFEARIAAEEDAGRINSNNSQLLSLVRQLNTLVYAGRDRFSHDAAELPAMMRARFSTLVPGLAPAASLPDIKDLDAHGFLLTQLRRQVNRFRDTLELASERISS